MAAPLAVHTPKREGSQARPSNLSTNAEYESPVCWLCCGRRVECVCDVVLTASRGFIFLFQNFFGSGLMSSDSQQHPMARVRSLTQIARMATSNAAPGRESSEKSSTGLLGLLAATSDAAAAAGGERNIAWAAGEHASERAARRESSVGHDDGDRPKAQTSGAKSVSAAFNSTSAAALSALQTSASQLLQSWGGKPAAGARRSLEGNARRPSFGDEPSTASARQVVGRRSAEYLQDVIPAESSSDGRRQEAPWLGPCPARDDRVRRWRVPRARAVPRLHVPPRLPID